MTTHIIKTIDWHHGSEYREIIWDDETGAVSGDHYAITSIRERLADPKPLRIERTTGYWELTDPTHVPAQFLAVLVVRLMAQFHVADLPPALQEAYEHLFDPPHFIKYPPPRPGFIGSS